MYPSDFPEVQAYPNLKALLRLQIDMQFEDLRTLLRLPMEDPPLPGGCNLATASLLFNVIAGASVLFYDSSPQALEDRRDRSRRFKGLLVDYYPWTEYDAFDADESSKTVDEVARNPLTHTLGVSKQPHLFRGAPVLPGAATAMMLEKGPLDERDVDAVTDATTRSQVLRPTLRIEGAKLVLSVWTLTWGVHRMLRDLFAHENQVVRAEATAAALING